MLCQNSLIWWTKSKDNVCLLTCASTRAVHLEVVTDLSYLQALGRFVIRKDMLSCLVLNQLVDSFVCFQSPEDVPFPEGGWHAYPARYYIIRGLFTGTHVGAWCPWEEWKLRLWRRLDALTSETLRTDAFHINRGYNKWRTTYLCLQVVPVYIWNQLTTKTWLWDPHPTVWTGQSSKMVHGRKRGNIKQYTVMLRAITKITTEWHHIEIKRNCANEMQYI